MKKLQLQLLLACIAVVILLIISGSSTDVHEAKKNESLPIISSKQMFYEPNNFINSVEVAQSTKLDSSIKGIVVPHHLLAGTLIAKQFRRSLTSDISTVIIVAPNHNNAGIGEIITANAIWRTAFGDAHSNETMVQQLMDKVHAKDEPDVFENEHSIGAIVPFVKYYVPNAKIVPIILSSNAREKELFQLAKWLKENTNENVLVVFSIDFSHYLPHGLADQKDIETRNLIDDMNVKTIMKLSNDHVDSPPSLATVIMYAQESNYELEILENLNSNDFSIQQTPDTTSYFTIVLREK